MSGGRRQLSSFWTLFILTGLNLFNYLDRAVLSAVLPSVQASLRLNDDQGGTLNTAFMLGYFVTSPLFGYLGDRMPRKWLIALGIFVWSVGTVLSGFATNFWNLLWFRVLVGVGEASYATISPSVIADKFFGEKRNNALTVFYVAIPVGAALGFIVGGIVGKNFGWQHAFIWAGAPGLLLAALLLPFADPPRTEAKQEKPSFGDGLRLFCSPNYAIVVLGYTAYTFALGGFQAWGQSFFVRVHHLGLDQAGAFFGGTMVVAGLLGTFIGGMLATAWHKKTRAGYALLLGWSVLAATPCAFAALMVANTFAAMSFLAITMFLLFLSMGPVNTLILDTVPAHLRASAMAGSIFMIHLLGDLPSPKIVGMIADRQQSLARGVLILPAALIPAAILWLILAVRLRGKSRQRRGPEFVQRLP